LKLQFAKELNRQLLEYYGRIPSAAVLARDFNLRAANVPQISQETARRWIRGLSIPELDKLQILVDWLGLDPNFMRSNENNLNGSNNKHRGKSNPYEAALLEVFRETDTRGKQMLLSMANTLLPGKIPPSVINN
jgi:hypothetical protein